MELGARLRQPAPLAGGLHQHRQPARPADDPRQPVRVRPLPQLRRRELGAGDDQRHGQSLQHGAAHDGVVAVRALPRHRQSVRAEDHAPRRRPLRSQSARRLRDPLGAHGGPAHGGGSRPSRRWSRRPREPRGSSCRRARRSSATSPTAPIRRSGSISTARRRRRSPPESSSAAGHGRWATRRHPRPWPARSITGCAPAGRRVRRLSPAAAGRSARAGARRRARARVSAAAPRARGESRARRFSSVTRAAPISSRCSRPTWTRPPSKAWHRGSRAS